MVLYRFNYYINQEVINPTKEASERVNVDDITSFLRFKPKGSDEREVSLEAR